MLISHIYEDPHAVISLTAESARLVRADRIVAAKGNPADKARERGFRDHMLGLPSRRSEYSVISQVTYDQGVSRAAKLRSVLRGLWLETELSRDGSVWKWAVYEEGYHIASGTAPTEREAGKLIDHAIADHRDRQVV